MIPKTIYQSWHTRDVHPYVQSQIDRIKCMNPEYTHVIYTDEEMDRFVDEHFPGEIAECYHRLNIIVAKVDFWRYLVLYTYGGVYLDMDSSIQQPLDQLIREEDDAIVTFEGNYTFMVQWALIFNKGHPILKRVIELVVDNIKHNSFPNDIHQMTGPSVYTRAIDSIHRENFQMSMTASAIDKSTDVTYRIEGNRSYRLYGVDYTPFFAFQYPYSHILYANKPHWRQEASHKQLLVSGDAETSPKND